MAHIHGKILAHSNLLRQGLAESLALLGSYPDALKSCSFGKAEATASSIVRTLLSDADWISWASLNKILPLLAEAAPEQFLNAVENSLSRNPCPFDMLFSQEGDGLTGENYTTGLLWALETLAWDDKNFTRVIVILGDLTQRDPGGKWVNRPSCSLTTILLPWLPQTCASIAKRLKCVEILLTRVPEVAWKLILTLLPGPHQVSSGSHKPTWRNFIPDNWANSVSTSAFWVQANGYIDLAFNEAKNDCSKLVELIRRLDDFPLNAGAEILGYLTSDSIILLPEEQRLRLWTELMALVTKHRKFPEAQWAWKEDMLIKIDKAAECLAPKTPFFIHQRLFGEKVLELLDEKGNFMEQSKALEARCQGAVNELYTAGGLRIIIEFAQTVELPWRVGFSFGSIAPSDQELKEILPTMLLESDVVSKDFSQFSGGFVQGRYNTLGWSWVDGIDWTQWSNPQIGQLLSYLPFIKETWRRAEELLGTEEHHYWTKTYVNPYEPMEGL